MTTTTNLEVIYRGNVQGVGFRYQTATLARQFSIDGFVRNQPDGTVQMIAIGAKSELMDFHLAVTQKMEGHIESSELNWSSQSGNLDLSGFEIRQ